MNSALQMSLLCKLNWLQVVVFMRRVGVFLHRLIVILVQIRGGGSPSTGSGEGPQPPSPHALHQPLLCHRHRRRRRLRSRRRLHRRRRRRHRLRQLHHHLPVVKKLRGRWIRPLPGTHAHFPGSIIIILILNCKTMIC